jgi:2-hydroxy-3-keto-5-methylthiopentenyl-1-phosphate phosphatase/uracil phosphoribosyltransferase
MSSSLVSLAGSSSSSPANSIRITSNSNSNSNSSNRTDSEPNIIGIFGLPNSGKSKLTEALEQELNLDYDRFEFFDAWKIIEASLPDGTDLEGYKLLGKTEKLLICKRAIDVVVDMCRERSKPGIVTGHFSFWEGVSKTGQKAMGWEDLKAFTHILYLSELPGEIATVNKIRPVTPDAEMVLWQADELRDIQKICRRDGVHSTTVTGDRPHYVADLIRSLVGHDIDYNEMLVAQELESMKFDNGTKTMLVIDADETLAPQDTIELFWKRFPTKDKSLVEIFGSPLEYSYTAFRQAALLYQQLGSTEYNEACSAVAKEVKMRPELKQLLSLIAGSKSVGVVVVTYGIKSIWTKVLERELPNNNILIVGGNDSIEGYVVTPRTKANVVDQLRTEHEVNVYAIGDGFLDVEMLTKADRALVVVGSKDESGDSVELQRAFKENGLRVRRIVLPPDSAFRLTNEEPPKAAFDPASFLDELETPRGLNFVRAANKSAVKLLTADSRNLDIHGQDLQRAERKIGWFLAMQYVSAVVGVVPFEFDVKSVQQQQKTNEHTLRDESKTLILPLSRGDEPMARGVWGAFPSAAFVDAKEATDLQAKHIAGMWTVILVDSVINSGESVVKFVSHIRGKLSRQIRIVVVARVVKVGVDAEGGVLQKGLVGFGDVSLIALHTSQTTCTETGHRLFSSTHLD